MPDTRISLAHGNGGRFMRELIEQVFARHLANPGLDIQADAVPLALDDRDLLFTTDGFTVQPLEFPGGDIGSLAVHGTTNDLAVAGAEPRYLALNAFIEEGMEFAQLDRIIASLATAARALDVAVVAGDTKIVRRGEGGGLYLATTGIGIRHGQRLGLDRIRDGDAILVSGPVGDHGIAVMLAREEFGLHGELASDSASVLPFTRAAMDSGAVRFMRDPTRGGLATVCHELQQATGLGVRHPLYLACEGRVIAVVDPGAADSVLQRWRRLPEGRDAARIGQLDATARHVTLVTGLGGERILEELEDDPLPRIC
jgi:hydrogenase expression/formation protein HypE